MNSLENNQEKRKFSFVPLIALGAVIGFILYFYALFFGERSIFVYIDAKNKLQELNNEYNTLQNQNQKLQKKYFELIQLTPDEDAF